MSTAPSSRARRAAGTLLATTLAAALGGCLGDVVAPTTADVAGFYQAEGPLGVMETDSAGHTVDWLEVGAAVELVLRDDGTTSGTLYLPPLEAGDGPTVHDLTGTWSLTGDAVTFQHETPTWLTAIVFRFIEETLTGGARLGEDDEDRRIRVTLVQL